jgi:U8 snoRNA-decapping enzyme
MRDNHGGLPSFLTNNFIGNAREQLLKGLKHEGLLSTDEIDTAMFLYKHIKDEQNCGL